MKTKRMKRQRIISSLMGCLLFCGLGVASAEPIKWADNGHYYALVNDAPSMSWEEARDWAFALNYTDDADQLYNGHLATITSAQENDFIESLPFSHSSQLVYFLGGYQIPTTNEATIAEKKADWYWVTDEEWTYTSWRYDAPNNGVPNNFLILPDTQSEEYLTYIPAINPPAYLPLAVRDSGGWDDARTDTFTDKDGVHFYGVSRLIVEYEPANDPHPRIEDPNKLLIVSTEGKDVTVDWSLMPEANSYTLYYAYADYKGDVDISTLGTIEMGDAITFFAPNLPSGLILYTAIMAHTHQGDIQSNIIKFMPFGGSVAYPGGVDDVLMQIDDPGGIGNFTVSGSVNGDTVNITQIAGDDGSGPFVLTVVDDNPVTYVKDDLTLNFIGLTDDSVAVQRARVWADASAQDVLNCQERINGLQTLSAKWFARNYAELSSLIHFLIQMDQMAGSGAGVMNSKALFLSSLLVGAREDLQIKFNEDKENFEQEYEACGSGPDNPANSCRLLYDPSLDKDGDYIIWINNEDNGFRCRYHSVDPWRLASETPYVNGEKDGLVLDYYEDGTLHYEIRFLNGEQNGISRSYWPNGNIWYETPMFNDHQDGLQKIYYESGILFKEIPWHQGDDFVDGVFKRYGENGNPNYETTYDENGKETGVRKQYYESGQLKSFVTLVSNKLNGETKWFYESGQLQKEVSYVDSEYHGTLKVFTEAGTLRDCKIYDHGSYEGSCMP